MKERRKNENDITRTCAVRWSGDEINMYWYEALKSAGMISHFEISVKRRDIGMGTGGPGLADRRCCICRARDVEYSLIFVISRPHPGTIILDGSTLVCAHKAGMTLGMHEAIFCRCFVCRHAYIRNLRGWEAAGSRWTRGLIGQLSYCILAHLISSTSFTHIFSPPHPRIHTPTPIPTGKASIL